MSELAKYIQESDIDTWPSGTYARWNIWIFKSPHLIFDCVSIDAKTFEEVGTICTLRTKSNKNIDLPVMGQFTEKLFCEKFNEVFEIDYLFKTEVLENIFGDKNE